jgi:hypothetical protein
MVPSSTEKTGRPRHGWMDDKMDFKGIGCEDVDWIYLVRLGLVVGLVYSYTEFLTSWMTISFPIKGLCSTLLGQMTHGHIKRAL